MNGIENTWGDGAMALILLAAFLATLALVGLLARLMERKS